MKILVIGNMGYVGPAVCRQLATEHEVYGLDNGLFANCLVDKEIPPENTTLQAQFFGDVRTISAGKLPEADAIVYLAAISNDHIGNRYESQTMDINCIAAERIARIYRNRDCARFILASSCSVYGQAGSEDRTEFSETRPQTAYAKSKLEAERRLRHLTAPDFRVFALRFATVCGYTPRLRLDLVLNDFVASAIAKRKVEVKGDSTPWRPLIHVSDVARSISWALHSTEGSLYTCVNVGSNELNVQIGELAHKVVSLIPGTSVEINENATPDNRSYKVDFSLYHNLAKGYEPQYSLEKSIIDLRENLERVHLKEVDFTTFIRLNELERLQQNGFLSKNLGWL